jgi:hypothetical protein
MVVQECSAGVMEDQLSVQQTMKCAKIAQHQRVCVYANVRRLYKQSSWASSGRVRCNTLVKRSDRQDGCPAQG